MHACIRVLHSHAHRQMHRLVYTNLQGLGLEAEAQRRKSLQRSTWLWFVVIILSIIMITGKNTENNHNLTTEIVVMNYCD